jgi:signal transduction histidine kinase/CheY-like chemotaxis protein
MGPRHPDVFAVPALGYAALGYAMFERIADQTFVAASCMPDWFGPFASQQTSSGVFPIADAFPFLEVFLADADEFWLEPESSLNLRSDLWTQSDPDGNPLHLCATAIVTPEGDRVRYFLLIEAAAQRYGEEQAVMRYAHETSLAHDRIAKLSRELERATQAKSEFLARMSHEIRTPMNALLGMADLLWETQLSSEQREYVRIFRRAGDNLLGVINDILDFSKVEAGQIELEHAAFDLADVLEKAAEVIAVRAHAKGLEVSCRMSPDVPRQLIGDSARLRQVLLNLLGNATKFTDRGELRVSVRRESDKPGHLHFEVADTGIGIPADRLDTIFESFTQADASTTRKYGGTGLGLAISKRFVELMDGRIWAESVPGAGSTMHFVVQLDVPVEGTGREEPDAVVWRGIRCAIAEANGNHRAAVADILTGWGATVTQLDSADQATPDCDVVLIDGRLPMAASRFEDVFEYARFLKESAGLRVVVMLTTDRLGDAQRCRDLGLQSILKPVRRADLLSILSASPADAPVPGVSEALNLRVLLADDSDENRFLIRGYLKGSECLIEEAENGRVAVDRFRLADYDVVLTDAEMPEMDGYSATRAIREFEAETGRPLVPIFLLTAHAFADARQRAMDAGCTGHLVKPIKKSTLLDALKPYARVTPLGGSQPQVHEVDLAVTPDVASQSNSDRLSFTVEPWLKSVVPGYLDKRRADVSVIRQAVTEGDFARARTIGHQLAGTGAGYGFEMLTELGLALEAAAIKEDAAKILAKTAELEVFLNRVELV